MERRGAERRKGNWRGWQGKGGGWCQVGEAQEAEFHAHQCLLASLLTAACPSNGSPLLGARGPGLADLEEK